MRGPVAWPTSERQLTEHHADAVLRFMGDHMLQPMAVDVIGFHGQTVLHSPKPATDRPNRRRAAARAQRRVSRSCTICVPPTSMHGGQGAPLAPVYHRALAAKLPERPVAFLNIGGVANVTWIGREGELLAFDTGPGNAMMDDWMQKRCGVPRDEGGQFAATRPRARRLRHPVPAPLLFRRAAAQVARPQCISARSRRRLVDARMPPRR